MHEDSVYFKVLSATFGAFLTSLIVTPLDVVKVRIQTQSAALLPTKSSAMINATIPVYKIHPDVYRKIDYQKLPLVYCNRLFDHVEPLLTSGSKTTPLVASRFTGTWDGILYIIKNEGLSSLWRGLLPTLMMSIPATVVYYVSYDALRSVNIWNASSVARQQSLDVIGPVFCGGFARSLAATVISPLELVRTRMQSISFKEQNIKHILEDVRNMIRSQSFISLWRGLVPTLWRDVPFSAIYWLFYEKLKRGFSQKDSLLYVNEYFASSPLMTSFAAGFTAGSFAAFWTTPFDVAKTRQQTGDLMFLDKPIIQPFSPITTFNILGNLIREEGISGIFRGLTARIVKVAPACAIMISCYEMGKSRIGSSINTMESL